MKKKRGFLLTFIIALLTVSYFKYLYLPFNPALTETIFGLVPTWFNVWSILAIIVGIPTVIGLWNWEKWGVYLFTFSVIIGFIFNNAVFNLPLWGHIGYYATVFLVFLAIYRKWKYFK